ncbi:protein FANTASTIC FOUR 1-like [Solanum tuberosum]|uniref:FAF domain-containing protein n=1 Tax=Solanum tuberosum TaxID=4113 RepID=M1BSC1_SOLTU|nr:PREDICTED: protein FANTASTIC FOUR 1-like [Solanum tuberosum]KAH0663619.1 hypothetical protein KY284_028550 [Solanum tuberosum]
MGSSSTLQSCMEAVVKALCKKGEESDFNELQKKGGNNNIIGDGWSLIQHDLCNPKKDDNYEKQVYVHPLVKRRSNTLSIKSLEMCTESLGSETGSDHISESSENNNYSRPSKCGKKHTTSTNKTLVAHFPPPLTSINNGLQLRPHREGDRLILKATTITPPKSCFKAERLDGRLTLSFWNNVDESDSRKLLGENGYIRPRKCKSRIKGIPTWETFWVSIS